MKNHERKLILASLMVFTLAVSGCGTNGVKKLNEASPASPAVTGIAKKVEQSSNATNTKNEVPWKIFFQEDLKFDFLKSGFISEKVGIASGFSGENYFTIDGGKNWTLSKNESNNTNGFDMVNDKIVWYGDDFGDVGVSNDMGKTWSFRKSVFIVRVNCISAIDSSTAMISTHDSVALTENGGKSLTDIKLPEKVKVIAASSICSKNEGYLLDFDGKIYHSNDKFKTWITSEIKDTSGTIQIRFEPGTSSSTAYMRCVDSNSIVIAYCGKDSGVYVMRSADGGKSWTEETVTKDYAHNVYVSPDGKFITCNSQVSRVNVFEHVD